MSYMEIGQLYKEKDVLLFKEIFCLEKIHGSSSHVTWGPNAPGEVGSSGVLSFFSGGEKQERFEAVFDKQALIDAFMKLGYPQVTVYGEVYGGKCQGMKATYGDKLRFIAFEVKVDDIWLSVSNAEEVARGLGFDFVHYQKIPATIEAIEEQMLLPSVQAVRNGCGDDKKREGVVLRPLIEVLKQNGKRIIAKHKNPDFQETKTKRVLSGDALEVLNEAEAIAEEYVVEMRLVHVLDGFPGFQIEQMGDVLKAVVEDIKKEAGEEIVFSKEARVAISKKAAGMLKRRLQTITEVEDGE